MLWETNGDFEENTLNALGLGLKINPPFFRGLTYVTRSQLDPRYVRIGGVVATIVRHYEPDKPDAVPIVLIACPQYEAALAKAVEGRIGHVFPFQDPAIDKFSSYSHLHDLALLIRVYDLGIGWHTGYLHVLKLFLK